MRKFGVSGLGFRVSGFRFWGASLGECANIPGGSGAAMAQALVLVHESILPTRHPPNIMPLQAQNERTLPEPPRPPEP